MSISEPILEVKVSIDSEPYSVSGSERTIVMIPFTGVATGPYFSGKTIGVCADTQNCKDGGCILSARYMLEGEDFKGEKCRIFIENNGASMDNCVPTVVTDSKALCEWEKTPLKAVVEPAEGGVIVKIYKAQ